MEHHEIVIIGGGPAGLAAALAAHEEGARDILILERDRELGGILNQCIHNGFGLHTFQEELTGPEYADRYIERVKSLNIPFLTNAMVIDINRDKEITVVSREQGLVRMSAGAVILAMGCRERPRGALNIPGFRPAGIYSAGTAQRLVNIDGYLVGREVVILGSGDIGLIMARRMTLEGARVKLVAELLPYSGGLKRNIVQCLDDYGIPLKLGHTVVNIHGKERLTGVTIAAVDSQKKPIPGTEEYYSCDTLLLSVGLLPENELTRLLGVPMDPATSGPEVNEQLETGLPGVFACGNVLHVHDLVDYVSEEAARAGAAAARWTKAHRRALMSREETKDCGGAVSKEGDQVYGGGVASKEGDQAYDGGVDDHFRSAVRLRGENGVRYTVPQYLNIENMSEETVIRFRVDNVYKNRFVSVSCDGAEIRRRRRPVLAPGEMEQFILKKSDLVGRGPVREIVIRTGEE